MARGFESKDVEYQQAERQRTQSGTASRRAHDHAAASQRGSLELALTRMRNELRLASAPAHRAMVESAIATLEVELASLD
jgi:hypothetical protein